MGCSARSDHHVDVVHFAFGNVLPFIEEEIALVNGLAPHELEIVSSQNRTAVDAEVRCDVVRYFVVWG